MELTFRGVSGNRNRARQGQTFLGCCWLLLLPLCWQPSILINLQQHLMADWRIVGKIYPGAVRCNCAAVPLWIFCAGFHGISQSSSCQIPGSGLSWHSEVWLRFQYSNKTLCSYSGLKRLHCAPPVLFCDLGLLGMVVPTENIKSCVKQAQEGKWLQENGGNKIVNFLEAAEIFTLLLLSWQLLPLKQRAYIIIWKCVRF